MLYKYQVCQIHIEYVCFTIRGIPSTQLIVRKFGLYDTRISLSVLYFFLRCLLI